MALPRSGLRGSKMIQNDQYNIFLTIWGHFGPIWTLLDDFGQNLIFCSNSLWLRSTFLFWGKKSSFVWNDPKESKWAQNDPKWPKICYIDHFGSFWTLVDHFGTSATLPCLVIFGPKRAPYLVFKSKNLNMPYLWHFPCLPKEKDWVIKGSASKSISTLLKTSSNIPFPRLGPPLLPTSRDNWTKP